MRLGFLAILYFVAPGAYAQDLKRSTEILFEHPAVRTASEGRTRSFSAVDDPKEMLAVLSTAHRLVVFPSLSFATAVEGQITIDGVLYRLFFPRIPTRKAPYVFALAPTSSASGRVYFEIPRERYDEFASSFGAVLNKHDLGGSP